MTQIFVVEKYAIARDLTLFEKDAQVRDANYFVDTCPALLLGVKEGNGY